MIARDLVKAHGGDWCGTYGLVSGPGHSPKDRSLKVWDAGDRVLVHSFAGDDWKVCRAHLGLDNDWQPRASTRRSTALASGAQVEDVSRTGVNGRRRRLPARVRDLLRTATTPDLVPDVVAYCQFRNLWPMSSGCTLKAHPGAPYWDAGDPPVLVGRFPALIAEIRDVAGELVTVHVTYLQDGRKLEGRAPRKILSGTTGHAGCAVRLFPPGPVLGVAEGVETAIAATRALGLPVWSCLNTSLLSAFEPPHEVDRLVIAADRDVPGLVAAWKLRDRLGIPMDLALPRGEDFAADLEGGE